MGMLHQFVHTLSYGDAISGEVLALQRALRDRGDVSEIYAINVHPKYKGLAHDYRDFISQQRLNFNGQVILHYSLGSPLNDLYSTLNESERVLIYHNLTPARWFEGVNPRIKSDIENGLKELPQLCKLSNRIISDSKFNADELTKFGVTSQVLNLPIDPSRWNIETNSGIKDLLIGSPGIHLLHVGRIAPNKCLEDIIKIFYFLHHHGDKNSTLWLPGIDIDTEVYSFGLKRLIYELNLGDAVRLVGCMDDSELKALYEQSSAYICMSEHEGFCLPVVEAMHFGLPVVAFESSALSETVSTGGILLKEKRHAEIAELILEITGNKELRERLVQAGHERVKSLSYESFRMQLNELLPARPSSKIAPQKAMGV